MGATDLAKPLSAALLPFAPLVATWRSVSTHPMLPGQTLIGTERFTWVDGGAFLRMDSYSQDEEVPSGMALIGADEKLGMAAMIYFDQRGVSRIYQTSMTGNVWRFWRDDPSFRQRFTGVLAADGRTMVTTGEMNQDGKGWTGDLSGTYTRI